MSLAFGLAGVFFLDKSGALGSNYVFSLTERLLFAPYNTCVYLYKLFFPYPMSTFYPYPNKTQGWLPTIFYITPFILLGVFAVTIWSLKHTRILAFGMLFFLFNIVFVLADSRRRSSIFGRPLHLYCLPRFVLCDGHGYRLFD